MKQRLSILFLFFLGLSLTAQDSTKLEVRRAELPKIKDSNIWTRTDTSEENTNYYEDLNTIPITFDGKVYQALVTEEGDTMILADLDDISITSLRTFENDEEYRKYQKFRRYAFIVYPYARQAIQIFREIEYAENNLPKKERKKKMKELEDRLETEFTEPLKKLTKLQGKILIKMIEKELNEPIYNLIKKLKGGFTAFYWHNFSKLYSYDLKEGYQYGKYKILDAVLQDFDISYRIENDSNLKYIKINRNNE
ncbi:MAG TPA: DUF4294 domain-containing protein [Saprospiraceae bacterium]|nr:DUF4294 domain-containing protein [Saprospiraceae bacterium]HPK09303.1 DUF4294 domain-containing protein [Saprospiraceae bacterium]HPQ20426.1 DUF4294 domain-containing protein [Saprospiraceae bacterium]HRX29477.1 DUF4294 domain-containing protein [Saprospiraceae bacterium]